MSSRSSASIRGRPRERGGVPVAVEVARALGAELGVVVARKLGAPVGSVPTDTSRVVGHGHACYTLKQARQPCLGATSAAPVTVSAFLQAG